MSLDITLVCNGEIADSQVSLSVESHFEIMTLAKEHGLISLLVLGDYYEEVHIECNQLGPIVADLETLGTSTVDSAELKSTISGLIELCRYAVASQCDVVALPD